VSFVSEPMANSIAASVARQQFATGDVLPRLARTKSLATVH
jgi:hypothetical protein